MIFSEDERMNRRVGEWDQDKWLNEAMDPGTSSGAWQRVPEILQAALTWSFLKNGPSTPEDLARLHEGLCFGERGPIALAVREEPRWMAINLRRILPSLSWIQIETAIAIFLAPMNPRSVKNRRLKVSEDGDSDTWGMANKGERALRGGEIAEYQRWLPSPLPNRREFLLWLHAECRFHEKRLECLRMEADPASPLISDTSGIGEQGRIFPVDMGDWWIQKQLFDHVDGIQWGYRLWRTGGTVPASLESVQIGELQRGFYPNGGLLAVRPGGADAFIGGKKHGLKSFHVMVRHALDALDRFDEDPHIETLIRGMEREAFAGTSQRKRSSHSGTWRRVRNLS